jgi:hypothetical protein
MEQMAMAGSILMTADTLGQAEGYIQVKPLGPVPVKGLAEPVEIFELTGAGTARTRLQVAALRGLTRFVGRDAEVEHLRGVLGQAGAGHGQVVAIMGEAGVGKSRLVSEFTHSHRVQKLAHPRNRVSLLRQGDELPARDRPAEGILQDRRPRQSSRDARQGAGARARAGPGAGAPPAATPRAPGRAVEDAAWQALDPPQRRQRTLDAVKRLLLRESQVHPLLVVFEGLHWIDGRPRPCSTAWWRA